MSEWSPNRGSRQGKVVDTIILHATAGASLDGAVSWLMQRKAGASAHYVIGKDGRTAKLVPTLENAWHAGRSSHPVGGGACNQRSIGIELVNLNDGQDRYPHQQIEALMRLVRDLKRAIPTLRYMYSHAAVARPKGRKTDPRGLDVPVLAVGFGLVGK